MPLEFRKKYSAKKRKTSLAVIFTTTVLILIVSVVVTLMLLFFTNLRSITYRQTETIVSERVTNLKDNVVNTLEEQEKILYGAAFGISALFTRGPVDQSEMINYFSSVTELAPDMQMLYFSNNNIWYEPNGFWVSFPDWTPAEGWDNTGRPWFIGAKNSPGHIVYSEPFLDAFSGEIIISLSTEVFDKDKNSIGVVAADVLVTKLNTLLNTSIIIPEQQLFLVNREGLYITNPNIEKIMKDNLFVEYGLADFKNNALSRETFSAMENDVFLHSAGMSAEGWTIVSMIPVSVIYVETDNLIWRLTLLSLVILAGVAIVSVLFTYRLIKNQNEKLQILREEAEAANRTKSNFLATMSHEIRTPMNAISGMAELLLQRELPDEAREEALDIKQAGNSLITIINDILDFSKIEAGKLEINPATYSPASLIHDTASIIRMRLGEKPIRFSINAAPDIPNSLIGDEVRLRQIMLNLLSNAVKYTEEGLINFAISSRKQDSAHIWLVISVRDTGEGIKSEDQSKLFGDFVRLDIQKNRGIEGTGLGLAITKKLCEAMGGSIRVESEYGKGSCFTAEIIQACADESVIGEETAENLRNFHYAALTEREKIAYQSFDGVKVLVVDDYAANLRVARGFLAPYQFGVDTAESGKEAVEKVQRKNYDMIFMDHMMPEMDGVEAVAAIRALGKNVPIVALTANAMQGIREFYLENGFDDYLSKPVNPHLLDEILKKWLPETLFSPAQAGAPTQSEAPIPELEHIPAADNAVPEALSRMKSEFLSAMSHKMKTPLTVISSHVKKAKRLFEAGDSGQIFTEGETIRHSLTRAQEEIMRAGQIIENSLRQATEKAEK